MLVIPHALWVIVAGHLIGIVAVLALFVAGEGIVLAVPTVVLGSALGWVVNVGARHGAIHFTGIPHARCVVAARRLCGPLQLAVLLALVHSRPVEAPLAERVEVAPEASL